MCHRLKSPIQSSRKGIEIETKPTNRTKKICALSDVLTVSERQLFVYVENLFI